MRLGVHQPVISVPEEPRKLHRPDRLMQPAMFQLPFSH
jgi:hypothetical protein